ncbi:MAG: hypothetical protein ACW98J_10400 [Candidatus Thorarchaeota archaeon]|jgi:hypothetical protein
MRTGIVRVLSSREFDSESVQEFFESKSKKRGLFKREPLEEVIHFPLIWRPFRFVHWLDEEGEPLGVSLIDEELASSVTLNEDEQILLWRPRYANLETHECEDCKPIDSGAAANDDSIQKIVDALIKRRNDAQDALEELTPDGRGADPQIAVALVIPRTPGRARKREKLADEIRYHHGILVGTSLVSDVPQEAKVQRGEIRDRAYVGTYLAEFRNYKTDDIRFGVMETPGTSSLRAAWSLGRALTRLCELSDASRKLIEKAISKT